MDLPLIYHPNYVAPIANTNRFPMEKFRLLYEMLIVDGVARPEQFFTPELPDLDEIALVHDREYVDAYWTGNLDHKAQRRIGLPWSPELAYRTRIAVGGTLLTARLALAHGLACNTAGGTHHAFPSYGSGFCIFNDLAIASRVLLKEGKVKKILIVDLDVHQGDGTALIFQDEPNVFTFSMHCQINFPSIKQISDRDVPLREGMEDDEYLRTLAAYLPDLLTEFQPDLVLYDAGVDPHIGDRLGKLALTDAGIFRRDMQVLSTCVSQGFPVGCVIGGGYCEDMRSLVYRHSLLHRVASDVYRQYRL
ncbi:deacetylases, including yeast histone deacetylase and acetoin utilization protein [Pseudanabaena sp. lw0831]|uniref:histone deacetylase family protein n=1 Tax=Pseudanabaena sp. lw0831 TaxID=1357935 RepID=UPI0019150907|nr:histone deacetylase [Pseudanabaena sp. lw0831]GBO55129.1 deacetylases, including yeast histone deacetylase and acetoin utilization protein [Pseudanabaena sp. lw0831]